MRRGLLATKAELGALKDKISQSPFDRFYDVLCNRCALVFDSRPITEMSWQMTLAAGQRNAATVAARSIQGQLFDLVIADAIDQNPAYISRAIENLRNLVRWSRWTALGDPELKVDLCTAEISVAVVIGLDWLWEDLEEDFRQETIEALHAKMITPYLESVRDSYSWWYESVNHWNAVINSACGIVATALLDDSEDAKEALELAQKGLDGFFDDMGDEGGWDEGIGFWGYAMRYVSLFGEVSVRMLNDMRVWHHRGMKDTGSFPLAFSPNGHSASFGYAAKMPLHGSLYLLDKYLEDDGISWWLDTYSLTHDVNITDWSKGMFILFRQKRDSEPKPPEFKPIKKFTNIGWGAMADRWPKPDFYVAAKTGDMSVNCSQRDMNSIQLQSDGELLLVDPGYFHRRDDCFFSQPGDEMFEMSAVSHNTIIIGDAEHRLDARGEIRKTEIGDNYRWMVCDGADACGIASSFYRHLLMICEPDSDERSLLVLDEISTGIAAEINLFWHVSGQARLAEEGCRGAIIGKRSSLNFSIVSNNEIDAQIPDTPDDRYLGQCIKITSKGRENVIVGTLFTNVPSNNTIETVTDKRGLVFKFGTHQVRFSGPKPAHRILDAIDSI